MKFLAVCLVGLLLAILGGCVHNGPPYVTQERLSRGLIVILPGIDGPSSNNASIRNGLIDANLPQAMEIIDWADGRPGVSYAFDEPASRGQAGEVANRILRYQKDHPDQPVVVIGHSAGGAISVFVAEAIAKAARQSKARPLAGIVMLAPALSPGYDLTLAMAGCGGNMLNCYAQSDLFLRTATTVGKNFDGVSGLPAGQVGFDLPPGAPERRRLAFENLRQIEWDNSMIKQSNFGGHLGWTSSKWVAQTLGPIVRRWAISFSPSG